MLGILSLGPSFWIVLAIAAVWELIWKGIALWKAGRQNQLVWFIFILIVNSAGILPIIYLAFFQQESPESKMIRSLERKIGKKG
jgi:hypothetical protein